jgi:pimeloyl-ACP methyl ester carboxylesterase
MQEFYIAGKDEVKTFVLNLKPQTINEKKAPSAKPPVFLIHGLTRNHKDFAPIFDTLLSLGHEIFAIDVRGRGKSEYDKIIANYNPVTYAMDVIAIFDELKIPPAIFIGTSMGGLISIILASFRPDLFKGIILNDVGPEVALGGIKRIRSYVGSVSLFKTLEDAAAAVKSINLDAFPTRGDDDKFWLEFAERTCRKIEDGFVLDYDPQIRESVASADPDAPLPDIWAQFKANIAIPTMLIRGDISDLNTTDIVEKMLAVKPDLIVANVPNVGHAPILNEPEAIAAIKEFSAKF